MASQASFLKLDGRMGDVSFYRTSTDGFLAREKGGVSADRIKNDPQFERTRENGAEFGRANEAGRLLRTAFRSLIAGSSDSRMTSRLGAKMMEVVKADATSKRGQRNVIDGEAELLQGFEFNANGLLARTLYAPYTTTVDRVANMITLNIPAFVPEELIAGPEGATHVRVVSAAAAIDFEAKTYTLTTARSADIVLGLQQQGAVNHAHPIEPNTKRALFLVVGLEFRQTVNGTLYPLKNGSFNTLAIVAVSVSV